MNLNVESELNKGTKFIIQIPYEQKIKVLIAEDDPFIGMITKECFETKGFEVYLCEDGNSIFILFR